MDGLKIAVCDDDNFFLGQAEHAVKRWAEEQDLTVELQLFDNGDSLLTVSRTEQFDVLLLDIMMPHMDGIAALTKLREFSNVPVILLTAKSEDIDKVLGLTVGADDYITKPFNPIELQARVKSQLRRYMQLGGGKTQSDVYSVGGIVLNPITKEVTLDSDPIALTRIEYNILLFLMQHVGQSFTPREIYQNVWHDNAYGEESTVAVHIRHLREKIEYNPAEPRYLKAVWGRGYKLDNN